MYKLLLPLLIIFSCSLNAQTLKVTYSETRHIGAKLASIPDKAIREMIKEKMSKPIKYELTSCDGISLYRKLGDEVRYSVYKNHVDNSLVEQKSLPGKEFLIEEKLQTTEWIFSDETQTIGGFECNKATLGDKVTVWYTKELPISDGPGIKFVPSALILKVEKIMSTITVEDMQLLEENTALTPPQKGEKVTREKFEKIQKEKFESMNSGGNVIRL